MNYNHIYPNSAGRAGRGVRRGIALNIVYKEMGKKTAPKLKVDVNLSFLDLSLVKIKPTIKAKLYEPYL